MKTELRLFPTHPRVPTPAKQTAQSACFDLTFYGVGKSEYKGFTRMNKPFTRVMNNQIIIQPGDRVLVPTGLIMDIPRGYSVRIHARSGMSLKQGLVLANAEGVIDSDYVDEVMCIMTNISDNPITIQGGERIAQAELIRDVDYDIVMSAVRPGLKTNRIGGMGSTGVITEGNIVTINIPEEQNSIVPTAEIEQPVKRGRGRPRKNG